MLIIRNASDAIKSHNEAITAAVQNTVRQLLEQKHLYQSLEVDLKHASEEFQKRISEDLRRFLPIMPEYWPWLLYETMSFQGVVASLAGQPDQPKITWHLPDAKLFCKLCDRLEPFNALSGWNILDRVNPITGGISHKGKLHQVFCVSYLCQSCKSVPEVFLIRRVGTRLSLAGRAPMEHVPVPKSIPHEIRKYYSDAVVAYQSGQVLAALFMLRTICEQWTRRFAGTADRADEALDKYMVGLPSDFNARFPSLRTIYSDLSNALHAANASHELFEKSLASIEEHFDARRLFKLA